MIKSVGRNRVDLKNKASERTRHVLLPFIPGRIDDITLYILIYYYTSKTMKENDFSRECACNQSSVRFLEKTKNTILL